MNTSPSNELLARVRIVLVEPQHPGNIGSAARAMKNMGLTDLALVRPAKFPHREALAMASGADDVLASARVFASLADAVADCVHVVGTSARPRSVPHNTVAPRELAARLATEIAGRAALVFGPERVGLSNDDLDLCDGLVSIPTNPAYSALNLAAAVQVLCYELRLAADAGQIQTPEHVPVEHVEMERFYEHLERVLVRIGFLDPSNPRFLMRKFRHLFGRAAPNANEMNILRGLLTGVENGLKK